MNKIISNFNPLSGRHCITNSLRQLFVFNGHDISEAMIFGMGSGLSWFYMENKAAPFPIISGRTKPLDFEQKLAENMGIQIKVHKTSSTKKAYNKLKELVESNKPTMLYVDMALLNFLNMPEDAHFGGHSVIVFGIDEEEGHAYISDRDGKDNPLDVNGLIVNNDFHKVPLEELSMARNSKFGPFAAQNKWVEIDMKGFKGINCEMVRKAINYNLGQLLNPPIKNLSISGIDKFSKAILKWSEFSDEKLKGSAINSYFMIDEKGGTGGAAFRKFYSEFLLESSSICDDNRLASLGNQYLKITNFWNELANGFWQLYETVDRNSLTHLSEILKEITTLEYDVVQKMKRYVYNL